MGSLKNRVKGIVRRFTPAKTRYKRVGEAFLRDGEREVKLLPDLIEPDTVAIDVGANLGQYLYAMMQMVPRPKWVVCVEPVPELASLLQTVAAELALPVDVRQLALSDHDGESELFIPRGEGREFNALATLEHRADQKGEKVRVPIRRLDALYDGKMGRVSFVKIDVEGHELAVLRGASETISKYRPNVMIEIETRHSTQPIRQTFDLMRDYGYRCEYVDPATRKRTPLGTFDVERHQAATAPGTPAYVNNFIFTPEN